MLRGPSASEVTTLWRYTNVFIIIMIIITHLDSFLKGGHCLGEVSLSEVGHMLTLDLLLVDLLALLLHRLYNPHNNIRQHI